MSARRNAQKSVERSRGSRTYGDDLRRALDWVLNESIFSSLKVHGNVSWCPSALIRLTIFWVWSAESSLVHAANEAVGLVSRIDGRAAVTSYQGLTNALKSYSGPLLSLMSGRLQALMLRTFPERFRVGIWLALAMDGSRVSVPRTAANERSFCKPRRANKGKKKQVKRTRHASQKRSRTRRKKHYDPQPVGPQVWLTMIWHIGLQLPWCWKVGPSYSSERQHVLDILIGQQFPENTLFCGDAGFCGYDFWNEFHARGHHFLVRVGGNIRLLRNLGFVRERGGIVYCWPDTHAKKRLPPLVLRLLHFRDARGDIYLVTNVLDRALLTDAEASQIYRQRWGIEVQFRSFKQTFNRSKLRSGTPPCVEVELNWSLIGLWMIQLLALKEHKPIDEPDEKTSVAMAIRIIRHMMQRDEVDRSNKDSLSNQLTLATTDTYQRTSRKKSRNYPRRKEEPAAGTPTIIKATKIHKNQLAKITSLATAG